MTDPKTILTESDRFVASWIVDRITSLPDDVHEKLTERLAIRDEKPHQAVTGNIFRKIVR